MFPSISGLYFLSLCKCLLWRLHEDVVRSSAAQAEGNTPSCCTFSYWADRFCSLTQLVAKDRTSGANTDILVSMMLFQSLTSWTLTFGERADVSDAPRVVCCSYFSNIMGSGSREEARYFTVWLLIMFSSIWILKNKRWHFVSSELLRQDVSASYK